jgi:hypothetical protein
LPVGGALPPALGSFCGDSSSNSSGGTVTEPEPPPPQKLPKAGGNAPPTGKALYHPDGLMMAVDPSADLSQTEMEEVLQLLRSRASPTGGQATRRPSLKDDHQPPFYPSQDLLAQEKSRRPSLDEIFDPFGRYSIGKICEMFCIIYTKLNESADEHVLSVGRKSFPPQVAQVYRAEISSPSPSGETPI